MFSFAISKLQCYGNYVLENWIAVVGFGGVALALAIVVFTTILVVKYKRSALDAIVICSILESQLKQFKYIIQIDVLPKGKASQWLKERKKKGFISKADNFIGGGKSAVFKVKTSSVVTFEIEGALKPMTQFKEGQNELKCTNIHKEVISRQIHLVPNISSSEDHAAITFTHDREFLYQITITDILQEKETTVKDLMSTRCNVLSSSGSAGSVDNEVLPLRPLPPGRRSDHDTISLRTGQRDDDDDDSNDESDGGNTRRRNTSSTSLERAGSSTLDVDQTTNAAVGKVLSSKSLMTLSDTLGPQDAKRLLKQLNMTDAEIKFERDNHPHDSAGVYANLFNIWKRKEMHRGESYMCQELNRGLERINRNDVRAVFERCRTENAELTADDFKGICG